MQIKQYLGSDIIDIKELLSLTLNKKTSWLYINLDYKLNKTQQQKLDKLITKRKNGYPFAYLEGKKGFYNLDFIVNENTLIPRPETENIIEIVKNLNLKNPKVLDLGTGSGIIAITLKSLFDNFDITATDINPKTLEVAKQNAVKNQVKINFVLSNWLENINEKFDIIISNPPYIEEKSEYLNELKFEPINALVAKDNGLSDIKNIIRTAPKYLNKNGYLLLEHGYNQQNEILKLVDNFNNIQTFNDLNNVPRNVLAKI